MPIAAVAGIVVVAAVLRLAGVGQPFEPGELLAHAAGLRGRWFAPLAIAALYFAATLIAVPVSVLIVATGIVFGVKLGFVYALLAVELSALAGFAIGHWLGHASVHRLADHWVARTSRQLGQRGLVAAITVRWIPGIPFALINLSAGATHIRLGDYALGTLLGMTPVVAVLTLFSGQLAAAVASPDAPRLIGLAALVLLIAAAGWVLRRRLRRRPPARP